MTLLVNLIMDLGRRLHERQVVREAAKIARIEAESLRENGYTGYWV